MINIAIVEDEAAQTEKLVGYLNKYADEHGNKFRIRTFDNAVDFLEKYTADNDIIFMDVKMPYLNGIAAARKLRKMDDSVILYFVTNMQQYAVKGYEVDAIDYIVKPINYYEFSLKLAKGLDRISETQNDAVIVVPVESGFKKLRLADVLYIEVKNHHCIFHTTGGEYRHYGALRNIEQKLSGANFERCNNYCLVNLAHVGGINGSLVTVGDDVIEMSRPRKKTFVTRFGEYFAGKTL